MEKKEKNTWQRRGVMALISKQTRSDVLGSYTGTPADEDDDIPVQDVDDL